MAYYLKYQEADKKQPTVKRYVFQKARDIMYFRTLISIPTIGLVEFYQGA